MAGNNTRTIKALIVDDSALIRQLLSAILNEDDDIEVVGTAADPYAARDAIKQLRPDVLTLDVEMPKMDGLAFLRNLMRLHPMPVVMVSTLTEAGAQVTLEALELGAVDFVTKPKTDVQHKLSQYAEELIDKVKTAARARVWARGSGTQNESRTPPRLTHTSDRIIGIGASTGGTEAIKVVIQAFPANAPATLVTQHIPAGFSKAFVERLNGISTVNVKQAYDNEPVLPGHVYFPPGDYHLQLVRSGAKYLCKLDDSGPVNRHRPSVDVLFHSIADAAGPNASAALLTGMGNDGAHGLLAIRNAGAHTIAQDEATSIVWGMPRVATELGAANLVLPLNDIGPALLRSCCETQQQEQKAAVK